MKSALSLVALAFGGTSVVLLMMVSVVDATSRALGVPVLGAKEVSEILMVFCVGAALPLSVLAGRTITIDGLVERFPRRARFAVTWAGVALSVLSMAVLAWRLVGASGDARDFKETTALLLIPHYPMYLYLAVGAALTAVGFAVHALTDEESDGPSNN